MEEKKKLTQKEKEENIQIQETIVNLEKEEENPGIGYEIQINIDNLKYDMKGKEKWKRK